MVAKAALALVCVATQNEGVAFMIAELEPLCAGENGAKRACLAVKNVGLEPAVNWVRRVAAILIARDLVSALLTDVTDRLVASYLGVVRMAGYVACLKSFCIFLFYPE